MLEIILEIEIILFPKMLAKIVVFFENEHSL